MIRNIFVRYFIAVCFLVEGGMEGTLGEQSPVTDRGLGNKAGAGNRQRKSKATAKDYCNEF